MLIFAMCLFSSIGHHANILLTYAATHSFIRFVSSKILYLLSKVYGKIANSFAAHSQQVKCNIFDNNSFDIGITITESLGVCNNVLQVTLNSISQT